MDSDKLCIVCNSIQSEGLKICDRWICSLCENEIVRTDVSDAKYPYFIDRLRQIWYKQEA